MMDLNTKLVLGFLIWSAFSLILIVGERIRSQYWKRAAKRLQNQIDKLYSAARFSERALWDSIPKGVLTWEQHYRQAPYDADEPTLIDIMALGKQGSCHDDSE